MNKIRILQVTGSLGIGGIEKLISSYYEIIDRNKFQMDFVVFGNKIGELENKIIELGGNVIRIPSPNINYFSFMKNIKKAIIDNGPYDVVHSHTLFSSGITMKAAYECNVPVRISHSHDNLSCIRRSFFKKIYIKIMRKMLLKYSTKICACSSSAGYYLFGESVFKEKGKILYNSIDVDSFIFDLNKRIDIRKKLNVTDEIIIGNIGRLETQKNQEFLINNFNKIKGNKKMKLVIIGTGSLEQKLKDLVKTNNLENEVILTGNRSDIKDLLCGMDLFVLPSIHEGLGIVLIEAQANGLPCVAPKGVVPDEAKILDNFVFAPFPSDDTVDEWVNLINKGLEKGRLDNVTDKIKKAGYDIELLSKEIESLYIK